MGSSHFLYNVSSDGTFMRESLQITGTTGPRNLKHRWSRRIRPRYPELPTNHTWKKELCCWKVFRNFCFLCCLFFVVYLLIFLCFFVSFSSVAIAVSLVFNLSGSRGPIYVGLTCFQSDHDSLLWGSRILILQILYLQKEKVRTRETIDLGSHDCSIYLIW